MVYAAGCKRVRGDRACGNQEINEGCQMLKSTHRLLFIVSAGFLLLACSALNLNAQVDPGGARTPPPAPTATPSPTPTPQPSSRQGGRVIGGQSGITDPVRNTGALI